MKLTFWELAFWELTFWEVDVLGVDILGVDILGVDILRLTLSLYWLSDGHALSPPSQHDAQMDYYGRRLATCSSDRTVKIFEIVNNAQNLVATLVG